VVNSHLLYQLSYGGMSYLTTLLQSART
jgi:hypothetical protein